LLQGDHRILIFFQKLQLLPESSYIYVRGRILVLPEAVVDKDGNGAVCRLLSSIRFSGETGNGKASHKRTNEE